MMMLEPTSYKTLINTLKATSWQSLVIFNQYILSRKHDGSDLIQLSFIHKIPHVVVVSYVAKQEGLIRMSVRNLI